MPSLSVVIPTRRRPKILRQTLERLAEQTIAHDLEVIVVHDGEDDGLTTQELRDPRQWPFTLQYLSIPKAQQGVARNRGVEKASAPLVLFIGDDIYLEPEACEAHVYMHSLHENAAVLGFTTWDPDCGITDVMLWLEKVGWQFGYPMIERYAHQQIPSEQQPAFSYTSNLSLPTAAAKKISFREDVSLYGWEDVEWGMRLKKEGIPLFYEPDAKGLHHHHMELHDSLQRMKVLGQSAVVIETINPDVRVVPRNIKYLLYKIAAMFPTIRGKHTAAFLSGIDAE